MQAADDLAVATARCYTHRSSACRISFVHVSATSSKLLQAPILIVQCCGVHGCLALCLRQVHKRTVPHKHLNGCQMTTACSTKQSMLPMHILLIDIKVASNVTFQAYQVAVESHCEPTLSHLGPAR
jgi:hypothetical protein